jgi:hypothetical protein
LADPWALPQSECRKQKNITIGGWLKGGIYGNQYGASDSQLSGGFDMIFTY